MPMELHRSWRHDPGTGSPEDGARWTQEWMNVNEFGTLFQLAFTAATLTSIVALVRLVARRDFDPADGLAPSPAHGNWPLGVQEEEPLPWNFGSAAAC
jgi:hypothetical protein